MLTCTYPPSTHTDAYNVNAPRTQSVSISKMAAFAFFLLVCVRACVRASVVAGCGRKQWRSEEKVSVGECENNMRCARRMPGQERAHVR